MFAGSGRLSRTMRGRGVAVLDPIDLATGPRRVDLSDPGAVAALKREILTHKVRYVHSALPCASCSAALRGRAQLLVSVLFRALFKPARPVNVCGVAEFAAPCVR